ncbi:ADP-specific phosphofructokinase/Glucokinase conserved region domain-containing protein [Ditylenchus destructor]|uniref:ADP-specific phosphofructokinase/Glucokinase conserved region domain-containing protein n=1 Tax=Ditylenchus destructor TaxID=166010 RepID=A0AAD4MVL5_9BILA|nr:ADP-specific phosphofructokinase/Glucokinase conserved region domain-containing protein [Ditylenchus destructor]
MFPFNTPYNYLLHWALICAAAPWLYSYFNEQRRQDSMTVEQAMVKAWERVIAQPTIRFRKIMVGINCNVDVIVTGVDLANKLNVSTESIGDKEVLTSLEDLYETFLHFFSKGAPAERYMADENSFDKIISMAEQRVLKAQYSIGGNAALMAQKIASSFPAATAYLVGPIGPRSQALLHPAIVRNNATRIVQDELHLILEYKQGEILGEYVAPASSRFITSHDQYSGSSVVIEMFFKAIGQFRPDLILFSGVHLLEAQKKEVRLEKLRLIKRSLQQVNPLIPIHLQLGSMGDSSHVLDVLERIIPYIDSLSINEQELAFLSKVGGGPYVEAYPVRVMHAYKVVEMLHWLMTKYGHSKLNPEAKNYNYRLQRIHFHTLTYHIMVNKGTDWTNLAAGLAAGARLAGKQACNMVGDRTDFDMVEMRSSSTVLLDKKVDKVYHFNQHNPLASWMRDDIIFIYTPVLVCKFPQRTVGVDDAITATALLYSQFYKMERVHWPI